MVGEKHLRLRLARGQRTFEAMLFGSTPEMPQLIEAVYRLDVNDYNGTRSLQLILEHWTATGA